LILTTTRPVVLASAGFSRHELFFVSAEANTAWPICEFILVRCRVGKIALRQSGAPMTLTFPLALKWISVASAVATPATMCMIRLNEIGDNPFRRLSVWSKVTAAWWLGLALSFFLSHFLLSPFGPILMIALVAAITGGWFELFFREGYWRGVWWAFGSLGILGIVVPLLAVGYSMLGPRWLGLL